MLARVLICSVSMSMSRALCLSVSVSVTSRCSIETAPLSYIVLKGNSGIFKNKGTSLWNFATNSGPRKFRFGIAIFETWTLRA